jgi:hypothetical protein
MHRKATKLLELFDTSLPLYDINSDELPFQKGGPLNPSNREEEQPAKNSTLEVFIYVIIF